MRVVIGGISQEFAQGHVLMGRSSPPHRDRLRLRADGDDPSLIRGHCMFRCWRITFSIRDRRVEYGAGNGTCQWR